MNTSEISGIYKIELKDEFKNKSSCNGIYIGQSVDIYRRLRQHQLKSKDENPKTLLYKAIKKYGFDNFNFSILERCDAEKLNDRENYWISSYNSCENGYNMTYGGIVLIRDDNYNSPYVEVDFEYAKRIRMYYMSNYENASRADCCNLFNVCMDSFVKIIKNKIFIDDNYKVEYLKDIKHGNSGADSWLSKLTWENVNNIRKEYKNKNITMDKLALKYNTCNSNISSILNNYTWIDDNYKVPNKNSRAISGIKKRKTSIEDACLIRVLYNISKSNNYRSLGKIFNISRTSIGKIIKNKIWYDDDWQLFLNNEININQFANIKNVNIDELKEWFNNGK